MKKIAAVFVVIAGLFCTAYAGIDEAGRLTPWDSEDIKINVAETFSDMADGDIVWDDGGFWTGTAFYEWPDAQWQDGRLVFTDFMGMDDGAATRMTFRIQTNQMGASSAAGSTGMGFYVENNTQQPQSIGFYMVGQSSCLKNKNGTVIYFISQSGECFPSTVTDSEMAIVPPGEKGYIITFYEDMMNLWSNDPYSPDIDEVKMPGFELTNLLVDGSKGETVVIDNVFFFGPGCTDNNNGIIRTEAKPTVTDEPEQTQDAPSAQVTESATEQAVKPGETASVFWYVGAAAVLIAAIAAAAIILRGKPGKKQ